MITFTLPVSFSCVGTISYFAVPDLRRVMTASATVVFVPFFNNLNSSAACSPESESFYRPRLANGKAVQSAGNLNLGSSVWFRHSVQKLCELTKGDLERLKAKGALSPTKGKRPTHVSFVRTTDMGIVSHNSESGKRFSVEPSLSR